jgi:hypothetical protein
VKFLEPTTMTFWREGTQLVMLRHRKTAKARNARR